MKLRAIVVLSALHLISTSNAEKLNQRHVQHKRQIMGMYFGRRRPFNLRVYMCHALLLRPFFLAPSLL